MGLEIRHARQARPRRAAPAAALAATLLLALTAAAYAHHGEAATGEDEPGTLGADNTGGTVSTDRPETPVAKDGAKAGWQQLGGSRWQPDGEITRMASPSAGQDSPTPYDLDLYGLGFLKVDVAMSAGLSREKALFEAQTNGFAVGAQCRRSDPEQPVPNPGASEIRRGVYERKLEKWAGEKRVETSAVSWSTTPPAPWPATASCSTPTATTR